MDRIKIIILIAILAAFAMFLYLEGTKSLTDLKFITGKITATQIVKKTTKNSSYRYVFTFKLDTSDQDFGIYLGTKKQAEKAIKTTYSDLKIGEELTVYYDTNFITEYEDITFNIYRLKHNNKTLILKDKKAYTNWAIVIALIDILLAYFFVKYFKNQKEISN